MWIWGIQVTKSLLRVQPPFSMSISPGLVPPSKLQIQAIRAESQWQVCGEWVEPTQESHKKLHIRTLFAMRKYVLYISTLKCYGRADIYYDFITLFLIFVRWTHGLIWVPSFWRAAHLCVHVDTPRHEAVVKRASNHSLNYLNDSEDLEGTAFHPLVACCSIFSYVILECLLQVFLWFLCVVIIGFPAGRSYISAMMTTLKDPPEWK